MGERQVTAHRDSEQLRFFMKCLLRDVRALEVMLEQGQIESDMRRVGAEQEVFLVDRAMRPALVATELLERVDDRHFTPELGLFNVEFNLDPFEFRGDCLRRLNAQVDELLEKLRKAAAEIDTEVVLTGILPTMQLDDLTLDSMTPDPRYLALNEALNSLRGRSYRFHIKGIDEIEFRHDSVMLEACNTSFQVHLQVPPEEFAHLYNIAQLVSAPVLSAAANSPLLFGRRLWRETRLLLFQQALDTRKAELPERQFHPRVSFGTDWVKDSVLEIFREDIARFRALLGTEACEDPFEALEQGRTPQLHALRLHNGTVYRWNRACYGMSKGKPHLRIENRVLPAGPTPADEVANAAFWFGLMHGIAADFDDVTQHITFAEAKDNMLSAARLGLDAQMTWLDGRKVPARELILDVLLPVACRGLEAFAIEGRDIEHYMGIIRDRTESGRTGACWMLESLSKMPEKTGRTQRMAALVAASISNQKAGRLGHQWPLAEPEPDDNAWKEHYGTVAAFMSTDLFTVHRDELVDLAANVMDWQHVRHVPVEDDDHHLVGLISHRSLLRFFGRAEGKERSVPVSSIMHGTPISVHPDCPTLKAIEIMRRERVSCLPVVDESGRLIGMVTEHDYIKVAADLFERKLRE